MKCNICNKTINGQYLIDSKNYVYCSDECFSTTFPTCYVCKQRMEEWKESVDGKKYCSDKCFSTTLPTCCVCKQRMEEWKESVDGKKYCSDKCFSTTFPKCCVCQQRMEEWKESVDGKKYCSDKCLSTTFPKCEVCQKGMTHWITIENKNYCDQDCLSQIFKYYRMNDVTYKLNKLGYGTIDVLLIGATGAGKSSTINSLTEDNSAEVGYESEPKTMALGSYRLSNGIQIWDTPGLGDSEENDKKHINAINKLLTTRISGNIHYGFIDMVILIVDASTRDMGTIFNLIDEIILPHLKDSSRLLIGLNQADMAMKGKGFDYNKNKPNPELLNFLEDKLVSVKRRIYESSNYDCNVAYYSAETGYNVTEFFDLIIDNIPTSKRYLG